MKEWSNAALYVVAIIVFIITLSLYFKLKNDDSAVEFSTYCEKAVYNLFTGDTSRYLETHRDNYDYMDFDKKMFYRREYNTSIKDKGKMTILQDRDQKNVKPIYLMDSYEKNKILMEQEEKDKK